MTLAHSRQERNGVGKNVFLDGVPLADLPTHKSTDIP